MLKVSVIIPCVDEAKFIGPCLDSVLSGEFPLDQLEILVVDGVSKDGTRHIVDGYAARHSNIQRLDNPRGSAPCALNIGLAHAKGEIIVRVDAHVIYPPNYISCLVQWLEQSAADNVGGIVATIPADERPTSRAIATALSHPFGVGDSWFRIGTGKPRWVETVPFGCYPRAVFARIGAFDEELPRNQDDEFNYRLIKNGGRILLVPEIISGYYARDSYGKLWRMYFQYGLFKPLVIRKIGAVIRIRQVVPALLVLSIMTGLLLAVWVPRFLMAAALIFGLYGCAVMVASVIAARRTGVGLRVAPWLCAAFVTIHWAYGLGFLCGIFKVAFWQLRGAAPASQWIPISR